MPQPRPLHAILDSDPGLTWLVAKVRAQAGLLDQVRARLPADLAGGCVCALRLGDQLVLFAPSPAWATRLRYEAPKALADLPGGGRIRIRVLPPEPPIRAKPLAAPRPIGPATSALLGALAQALDDPELRAALGRLARRDR